MLRLYQSNRLELLSQRLALLLSDPVASPLQPETLVVQHPGMARWLSLEIARQAGICANNRFLLPGVFVWELLRAFLPDMPVSNRFEPARLTWRLYQLLGNLGEEPVFAPLRHYLRSGDETKRYQLAERLAGVFDRYLVYRPDWILRWESGQAAEPGDEWQAELWRRLSHAGELHWVGLQQQLQANQGALPDDLPPRLFLFGVPTLSPGYLAIMQWLSERIDVHLFLLNPCEAHWAEIVDETELARRELVADGSELYLDVGNPLLASLGRQGRDFFAAINELDPGSEEWFTDPGEASLLTRLQSQMLRLEMPQPLLQADPSILFHICHSPMREVEVLYDQLLGLFETLPDLQASEILVMTPDIDGYAPLIEAVFSQSGDRPPIPFSLSDLGGLAENRLLTAFLTLLDMPQSRFGVNQILELLEVPEIAARFGLDETALVAVTDWIAAANIRWGEDGESKRRLGLPPESRNTWRAGLERLLVGYAMPPAEQRLWQDVAPLDAVEGSAAPWLGGLLSFCESLFGLERQLTEPRQVSDWCDLLQELAGRFFVEDLSPEQPLQQIRDAIGELREEAGSAGFSGEIPLALLRQRLAESFSRPSIHGFLGGGVNFCALAPMRSLPFRVICLIGMNEGAFPREPPMPGFDLMSRRFRFGDRSRRADDRYLFLELLISARERLYISHVGRDIRNNSSLPPSVLVDELRDYLALQIGEEGLAGITHQHPLQPFSAAYFGTEPGLFSYSPALRECARLAGRGREAARPLIAGPLPEPDEAPDSIDLDRLLSFYTNPAAAFAQRRLGLRLEAGEALLEERESFVIEGFEGIDIEATLVNSLLDGVPAEEVRRRFEAQGCLPHGNPGRLTFQRLHRSAQAVVQRIETMRLGGELLPLSLEIELGGMLLSGRLRGLRPQGLFAFSTGKFHPFRKLELWIGHLLLNLLQPPGIDPVSSWLEQDGAGRFTPVAEPALQLERLLTLYRQGLREPLHFYPGTSWAYMEKLDQGADPLAAQTAAEKKWFGNERHPGDCIKPYNRLLMSAQRMLDERFAETAVSVLQPLFEHMEEL
jgi:exodeoxyribonuclease V gamma subunit